MDMASKEIIRQAVRNRYGKIASAGSVVSGISPSGSCCGESGTAGGKNSASACCGGSDVSSEQMSALMGYSKKDFDSVPEGANMGLGCGNPVALASLQTGETVVDLGSGGGFDCFLAAKQVGHTGKVIGVDMTPDMLSKARANAEKIQAKNVEFRLGEIEHLPIADETADVIISNCVINLSPDKPQVFAEMLRTLKPGGRVSVSDIVTSGEIPASLRGNMQAWGDCVAGALDMDDYVVAMKGVGFEDVNLVAKSGDGELLEGIPQANIFSASITAVKPIDK